MTGVEIGLGARSSLPVDRVTFAFWVIHLGLEAVPVLQVLEISRSPVFEMEFFSDLDLHSWKPLHSLTPTATQNLRNAHGPTDTRKETGAVTIAGCIDKIRSKVGE